MSPQQPIRVDPKIWQCCAGAAVKIPKLNSHVYYFPLGHLEHVSPSPNPSTLSLLDRSRQFIPCTVSTVNLLADPVTDEVFVKLLLTPGTNNCVHEPPPEVREDQHDGVKVVSSGKTLTPSDANNGGAFSVPSECAKLIFPPLDLQAEKPSQKLSVTDIHGKEWKLRHVYRGTPLRHLITTNWSEFVDEKKLIGGDSLVFMKKSTRTGTETISVGIHRQKFGAATKIAEKSVTEAVELAEKNMAFDVVYYPTAEGWCDFVVNAKVVEDAMKNKWNSGLRIKHSLKKDNSSKRCSNFEGTISALSAPNRPWRMLEVRTAKDSALHNDIERDSSIPKIKFHSSTTRSFNEASLNSNALLHDTASTSSNCNTKKLSPGSIMLFGQIIRPVGSDLHDSDIKGEDGGKGCNENCLV
ncbi:putative transcription factor ARF family [Medicago truncatula]|uniref:Auxin response factor 1 n=1 Tax=Medicago truncatula TaxID=3880 RepID=G7KF87_MEDTR|nr:auxin response factor 17 [Medicago truncatula]AES96733.1 auxin response factor 1 [Medicago truncatula]RHN55385.1 putative transcription factor ARF family [Medicago truncatula]